MKFTLILFSQLLAFPLFSQEYKYGLDVQQYRLNYFSHKGDVSCKDCKYYAFSAKYPDGSDVPLCRMINNCIFSQMLFVKKYMDQDDKLAQYQVTFGFKTLKAFTGKREAKIDQLNPAVRKYYYRIPLQSVLHIEVTNKADGRVILDSTITTNGATELPGMDKPELLTAMALLDSYYEKHEKELDYALMRRLLWPTIEKQLRPVLAPVFEDEEKEIELKFFTVATKDPDFGIFKELNKKMALITAEINKANKTDNHPNWHTASLSKTAAELLKEVLPYLDPKYSERITNARLKPEFINAMRYNVLVLQLLSSSYEEAATSLSELKSLKAKQGQSFGPKRLDDALEDLEPVLKHEKRYYQEHKSLFGYQ